MATVGDKGNLTYADLAKTLDPKGEGIAQVIDMLSETNAFVEDMPVVQCNMTMAHRITQTAKLPESFWRSINKGVAVSKGETKQIDETTGQLAARAQVDRTLAAINGNTQAWMLQQESLHVESMNQEMERTVIYGNMAESDAKFTGLAPRYSSLNKSKYDTANFVIDCGGRGATNTSAWLVHWDDTTAHGIYPKGIPLGLTREHKKDVDLLDDEGNEYPGHKSYYEWTLGLAVPDYRYVVRFANIDTAELDDMIENGAVTPQQQRIMRKLLQGFNMIPNARKGKPVLYASRSLALMLDIIAMEKSNVNLTTTTIEGGPGGTPQEGPKRTVTTFRGVPVRLVDAIRSDEMAVTAA